MDKHISKEIPVLRNNILKQIGQFHKEKLKNKSKDKSLN